MNEHLIVRGHFTRKNLKDSISDYIQEVQDLYLQDSIPWVIGYSGGKDSSAVLQLVWMSIEALPEEKRLKEVHVITTDTLVENPVVSRWVINSLNRMEANAKQKELPISTHLLTPDVESTFWVNLLGRGYPAPRNNFRWCTDRLKIKPSNTYIKELVKKHGEAILLLGMRKAESSARAAVMNRYEEKQVRDRLNPSSTLPNCLIYPLISEWTNDDVWLFLLQYQNPWGHDNKDLLSMYSGATADGECPIVVDTSTPSCGNSRFGCWVCTLVEKDKSMGAMIKNDFEKEWMLPLIEFRNLLDFRTEEDRARDRERRDFRRASGAVVASRDGAPVPGPYTQDARANLLRKLLETQREARELAPESMKQIELITIAELDRIREIWVMEKNEIEDLVPKIYQEVNGCGYPGKALGNKVAIDEDELELLRSMADDIETYELMRNLMNIEYQHMQYVRRPGLFEKIKDTLKKYSVENRDEAVEIASAKFKVKKLLESLEGEFDKLIINELGDLK